MRATGRAGPEQRADFRGVRAPLVLVLMMALACGSGDPPRTPSPDPDPSPSPPAAPTPPTPPIAAPPTTPHTAASVSIERISDDPECAGVVPDGAPEPVPVTRSAPAGHVCAGGISDGTGHVAVAARAGHAAVWGVFDGGGAPLGSFSAWPVVSEPSGWQGLVVTKSEPSPGATRTRVELAGFGPDGAVLRSSAVSPDPGLIATTDWDLSVDPLGGTFVLLAGVSIAGNHWSRVQAQRFDAAADDRWSESALLQARSDPNVLFLGGGVSRAGESLAIWQDSAWVNVAWQDRAGSTLVAEEQAQRSNEVLGSEAVQPDVELVALLDGGVAVRADGAFRSLYPHLASRAVPAPAWLASRAAWTYRFTRGNRGYAFFPPPQASADCAQAIDLLAPSGRLCGRVVLHATPAAACTTGLVDQGWDGTVVQQATAGACTYRFWPRLLAAP
jgi:hypothetical protein